MSEDTDRVENESVNSDDGVTSEPNDDVDAGADRADGEEKWKQLSRKHEQRWKSEREARKELERKLAEASKKPAEDGDKPDIDEIRRQAREEAAAESLRERVMDKIEAKARRFADSEDAAAILLRSHDIGDFVDGGKVDADAIAEALEELAEKKPHLLSRNGSSGGSFDTGRGKRSDKSQLSREDLKGMTAAQIEAARKAGRLDRLMGKTR